MIYTVWGLIYGTRDNKRVLVDVYQDRTFNTETEANQRVIKLTVSNIAHEHPMDVEYVVREPDL